MFICFLLCTNFCVIVLFKIIEKFKYSNNIEGDKLFIIFISFFGFLIFLCLTIINYINAFQ